MSGDDGHHHPNYSLPLFLIYREQRLARGASDPLDDVAELVGILFVGAVGIGSLVALWYGGAMLLDGSLFAAGTLFLVSAALATALRAGFGGRPMLFLTAALLGLGAWGLGAVANADSTFDDVPEQASAATTYDPASWPPGEQPPQQDYESEVVSPLPPAPEPEPEPEPEPVVTSVAASAPPVTTLSPGPPLEQRTFTTTVFGEAGVAGAVTLTVDRVRIRQASDGTYTATARLRHDGDRPVHPDLELTLLSGGSPAGRPVYTETGQYCVGPQQAVPLEWEGILDVQGTLDGLIVEDNLSRSDAC